MNRIIPCATAEQIITGTTDERVAAVTAQKRVVAGAAVEYVGKKISDDTVGVSGANNVFDIAERIYITARNVGDPVSVPTQRDRSP